MIKFLLYCYFVIVFVTVTAESNRGCVINDARRNYCGENEVCVESYCDCMPGYTKLNDACVRNNSEPSARVQPDKPKTESTDTSNHLAVSIVVPLVLIAMIAGSIVLVRKYNIAGWLREKIAQRESPYDEVMIGQDDDDPPLVGV